MTRTRNLTENELIGYIVAEPIRGALAEVLLDALQPPAEHQLLAAAAAILKEAKWKATNEDIRVQIARLHAVGLAEPVVVGDQVGYTLTVRGRATVSKAFELPSARG